MERHIVGHALQLDSKLHAKVAERLQKRAAAERAAHAAFLFHVHKDGSDLGAIDEELPEESMAPPTARGVARELLADIEGGWRPARIEVADERGDVVGVIPHERLLASVAGRVSGFTGFLCVPRGQSELQ